MIKKILLGLVAVIVLLIAIAFLLPGEFKLEKKISIYAPPLAAFEEVNTMRNWPKWSYWHTQDSAMTVTYGDEPSGVGAYYAWKSEKMGDGKLTITESIPPKLVAMDLDFGMDEPAKASYRFETRGDTTVITADFSTSFGMNPFMRWLGVVLFPSEMNKAYDYSLQKLKEIAEQKPLFSVDITETEVAAFNYIGLSSTLNPQDEKAVSATMEKSFTELAKVLAQSKVNPAGPPLCLYPSYTEQSMTMVCAFPVAQGAKVPAKYRVMENNATKVVRAVSRGDYQKLFQAHTDINNYIKGKGLKERGAVWEAYITDPTVEKDTAKWITEIYYPVE